jgi:outer membrane protein assembly factor BamB
MNASSLTLGRFIPALFAIVLFTGCKKDDRVDPPLENNTEYGVLYSPIVNNGIGAVDLQNDSLAWTRNVYLSDRNSFVYENETIYTANLAGVSALHAKTGAVLWSTTFMAFYSQSNTVDRSRPVIKDSLLYVIGFWDGEDAGLRCLNKQTGQVRWAKNLTNAQSPRWEYSTPIVVGDKVIAVSKTRGPEAIRIHCFNRLTGAVVWYKVTNDQDWLHSAIEMDANHILLSSASSQLYKLNVNDGSLTYFASTLPSGKIYPLTRPHLQGGEVFVGTFRGIQVFDAQNAQLKRTLTDSIATYAITSKAIYYQKASGVIHACDVQSLTRKWTWVSPLTQRYGVKDLSAAVYSVRSCLVSDDEIVYYYEYTPVLNSNSVFLLNAETGALIKEIRMPLTNDFRCWGITKW